MTCFNCGKKECTCDQPLQSAWDRAASIRPDAFAPDLKRTIADIREITTWTEIKAEHESHLTETDEASVRYYAQQADHALALISEEEKGYERGLRDGKTLTRYLDAPTLLTPEGRDDD